jgi:hypothetical protein
MSHLQRMTVREIALMREIVKWRKANGVDFWRARPPIGRFIEWTSREHAVAHDIGDQQMGYGTPRDLFQWVDVETLTQAVDLLVALGYLPARFSTAYRTGWDAHRSHDEIAERLLTGGNLQRRDGLIPAVSA